jgi:hypothetical protein
MCPGAPRSETILAAAACSGAGAPMTISLWLSDTSLRFYRLDDDLRLA